MMVRELGTKAKSRFPVLLLSSVLLLLTAACANSPTNPQDPLSGAVVPVIPTAAYADELLEQAIEAEHWISPVLVYLAEIQNGEMIGLEFRLKSLESTSRKIEAKMLERELVDPRDVRIRDALRYTMQFADLPGGHYDQSVAYVLVTMESMGHTVTRVKNYWPRGDDYSGVNTNLRAPNGLEWELQFHTPESFALKMSSHEVYEQVRQPGISIEVRQSMFMQVSQEWDEVPIPAGILEPGSLHLLEEVIVRPSP